jgi:hypothetical protein
VKILHFLGDVLTFLSDVAALLIVAALAAAPAVRRLPDLAAEYGDSDHGQVQK